MPCHASAFSDFVTSLPERFQRRSFWFYWWVYKQRRQPEATLCDFDNAETIHLCPPTPAPLLLSHDDETFSTQEGDNSYVASSLLLECLDHPEDPACQDLPAFQQHDNNDSDSDDVHGDGSIVPTSMPTGAASAAATQRDPLNGGEDTHSGNSRNKNDDDDDEGITERQAAYYFNCVGHEIDKRFCERPKTEAERQKGMEYDPTNGYRYTSAPLLEHGGSSNWGDAGRDGDRDRDRDRDEEDPSLARLEPWDYGETVTGDQEGEETQDPYRMYFGWSTPEYNDGNGGVSDGNSDIGDGNGQGTGTGTGSTHNFSIV